jgi:clan AA aspartic protease (TIGR02281 family)
LRVVLDLGSTYVTIPWHIAEVLGYKPGASKSWETIITAAAPVYAPKITLKSVKVLGLKVDNVDAIVHTLPEVSRVDGLLGLSYLRNFRIIIDFKNGLLTLE